ncbi:MAG: hypothetical protein AAB723_00460 [Patescibacteria group bacterium]
MEFDLVNGIRYKEEKSSIIFSKNGEQEFFYSIPPGLSKKATEKDCKDFLAAKGLLKNKPPMAQWE